MERIEVRRINSTTTHLVQIFSDGTEGLIAPLGFTFEKYDPAGTKIDSVEIPNGGKLKLQTLIRGN